jgi:hypothetical protein
MEERPLTTRQSTTWTAGLGQLQPPAPRRERKHRSENLKTFKHLLLGVVLRQLDGWPFFNNVEQVAHSLFTSSRIGSCVPPVAQKFPQHARSLGGFLRSDLAMATGLSNHLSRAYV